MSTKEQATLVKIAKDMMKNKLTIRAAADKYDIARATLHKRLHNQLPLIDADLYAQFAAATGKKTA